MLNLRSVLVLCGALSAIAISIAFADSPIAPPAIVSVTTATPAAVDPIQPPAQEIKCASPGGVPVMRIAVVSEYSSDPKLLGANQKLDDASLVCVVFGEGKVVKRMEFTNYLRKPNENKAIETISFADLVATGFSTDRVLPIVGERTISTIQCKGCVAGQPKMKLRIGMLHSYKLIGKNTWKYFDVEVDLEGQPLPQASFGGVPFEVMTVQSVVGLGGGAKQVRFSDCNAVGEACLKDVNPGLKHGSIIKLESYPSN